MKKLIYNKLTGEFIQDCDATLNPNNWVADFKRFILSQLKGSKYAMIPKRSFSKKSPSYEIVFSEAAMIQIHILDQILMQKLPIKQLVGNTDLAAKGFLDHIKTIQNSTLAKLKPLSNNPRPDNSGLEQLDHIAYRGRKCYSMESHGDHRIIYDIHDPYRITITSIFFHYEKAPIKLYDKVLLDLYNDYIINSPSDDDVRKSFTKFVNKI